MSNPTIAYTSIENTRILELNCDELKQVGSGFVIWHHVGSEHVRVWLDGKEFPYKEKLNGCCLQRNIYTRFYGEDHEKRCWSAVVGYADNKCPAKPSTEQVGVLRLTCAQVDRLLNGANFAMIVEECLRADHEAVMQTLETDALFGKQARQALTQIYALNGSAGTGSRKAVREIILHLLPELGKTEITRS